MYAFPQWNKTGEFDHATCNGGVNALLRSRFKGFTTHCFRHTLADRLKDANVRPDIINGFCGWADKGMQSHYGQSDKLELLLDGIKAALAREGRVMAGCGE